MIRFALRLFIVGLAIYAVSAYGLIPGIDVKTVGAGVVTALILTIVNALVRPIVKFFTFPLYILTLGLFSLIVNAFMLLIVAALYSGLKVAGFWPALWGALFISFVNMAADGLIRDREE